jgi:hypothetical protein
MRKPKQNFDMLNYQDVEEAIQPTLVLVQLISQWSNRTLVTRLAFHQLCWIQCTSRLWLRNFALKWASNILIGPNIFLLFWNKQLYIMTIMEGVSNNGYNYI